jgi:hypothetical protein
VKPRSATLECHRKGPLDTLSGVKVRISSSEMSGQRLRPRSKSAVICRRQEDVDSEEKGGGKGGKVGSGGEGGEEFSGGLVESIDVVGFFSPLLLHVGGRGARAQGNGGRVERALTEGWHATQDNSCEVCRAREVVFGMIEISVLQLGDSTEASGEEGGESKWIGGSRDTQISGHVQVTSSAREFSDSPFGLYQARGWRRLKGTSTGSRASVRPG